MICQAVQVIEPTTRRSGERFQPRALVAAVGTIYMKIGETVCIEALHDAIRRTWPTRSVRRDSKERYNDNAPLAVLAFSPNGLGLINDMLLPLYVTADNADTRSTVTIRKTSAPDVAVSADVLVDAVAGAPVNSVPIWSKATAVGATVAVAVRTPCPDNAGSTVGRPLSAP